MNCWEDNLDSKININIDESNAAFTDIRDMNEERKLNMKLIKIKFSNLFDFKKRICSLWQNQKENDVYEFEFSDKETEDEYIALVECFKDKKRFEEN